MKCICVHVYLVRITSRSGTRAVEDVELDRERRASGERSRHMLRYFRLERHNATLGSRRAPTVASRNAVAPPPYAAVVGANVAQMSPPVRDSPLSPPVHQHALAMPPARPMPTQMRATVPDPLMYVNGREVWLRSVVDSQDYFRSEPFLLSAAIRDALVEMLETLTERGRDMDGVEVILNVSTMNLEVNEGRGMAGYITLDLYGYSRTVDLAGGYNNFYFALIQ